MVEYLKVPLKKSELDNISRLLNKRPKDFVRKNEADFKENNRPFLFMTNEEHAAMRALNISKEYNLTPWILGSGYEYRRIGKIKSQKPFFIFPLNFPAKPKVSETYMSHQYST